MSGSQPRVPQPGPEEAALLRDEAALLREGTQFLRGLDPVVMAELGLTFDPKTGQFTAAPDAALGQGNEILRALQARSLRLARGEMDADPFLERAIAKERNLLNERLLRQLGPGGETSSPGLELLSRFGTDVAATRAENARNALSMFEGLSLNRRAGQDAALANRLNRFSLLPQGRFTAAELYGQPLSRYQAGRIGTFQAEQAARRPGFGEIFSSNFAAGLGQNLSKFASPDTFKTSFVNPFGGGS
ncbi:MAG TPA: hypothetical protein VF406_21495 [Thermodesulfobacteriota bacterium]